MTTTNTGKSKKEEYNPIQGDILAFLNEVTKMQKDGQSAAPDKANEAVASTSKPVGKGKGLNMNSDEAFPILGEGIPITAPSTSFPDWTLF